MSEHVRSTFVFVKNGRTIGGGGGGLAGGAVRRSAWHRWCGLRGVSEQLLEVGAFDSHSPSDPHRWQCAG
jgi:hypothetical protein